MEHRGNKRDYWRFFYSEIRRKNVPLMNGYDLTTYKSQGDSFGSVYVDVNDIKRCRSSNIFQMTI